MKKIILESSYANYNWGDAAMLEEGIRRLRKRYPNATITLTDLYSSRAAEQEENVQTLAPGLRAAWARQRPLMDRIRALAPAVVDYVINKWPRIRDTLTRAKMLLRGDDLEAYGSFLEEFEQADALCISGGGHITDVVGWGDEMLDLIMLARSCHLPVFMFGQGIGPITSKRLQEKAARVLPEVSLLALRERKFSNLLVRQLGVSDAVACVTGDDAVSLAYQYQQPTLGNAIGVNVRVGVDSDVPREIAHVTGRVLGRLATNLDAELIPVPISHTGLNDDLDAVRDVHVIRELLNEAGQESDGGQSMKSLEEVIRQVGRCRAMVTGSYHSGVFALSQGVPIVGLYESTYYENKLEGLADMFGTGCTLVRTDRPDFETALTEAVQSIWRCASEVRPELLAAAERQIEAVDAAYDRMARELAAAQTQAST